jgi:hypothetical protein
VSDLILVPEVDARRILRDRRIRLRMLAPYGAWFGCGRLRVLRLTARSAQGDAESNGSGSAEDELELTVGYEAYQP